MKEMLKTNFTFSFEAVGLQTDRFPDLFDQNPIAVYVAYFINTI